MRFVHDKTLKSVKTISNLELLINKEVKKKNLISQKENETEFGKNSNIKSSDDKYENQEDIILCEDEKFTDDDKKLIQRAMSNHFLFKDLSKNIM